MAISLPYIFQVFYVLCFTRPRYQVSVYRTIGLLVLIFSVSFQTLSLTENSERKKDTARALTSGTKGILPEDEKRKSIEVEDFELWKGYGTEKYFCMSETSSFTCTFTPLPTHIPP